MTSQNKGGLNLVKESNCGGMPTAVNSLQLTSLWPMGDHDLGFSRFIIVISSSPLWHNWPSAIWILVAAFSGRTKKQCFMKTLKQVFSHSDLDPLILTWIPWFWPGTPDSKLDPLILTWIPWFWPGSPYFDLDPLILTWIPWFWPGSPDSDLDSLILTWIP